MRHNLTEMFAAASRLRRAATLAVGAVAVALAAPAHAGLTFTNTFTSFTPALQAQANAALANAEGLLSSLFSNNVNLTINFEATNATGLADANFNGGDFPSPFGPANVLYAQVKADMVAHTLAHPENTAFASTVAALPANVTCPGCNSNPPHFLYVDAEKMALKGAAPAFGTQGFIRLNPSFSYDTDPSDGIGAGQIDLTAVFLHEITHVMGRVDYSFCGGACGETPGSDPFLTILDLDRFNCNTIGTATPTRNTIDTNACFSIDGGATSLRRFSATSDTGDWDSAQVSANNAFLSFGTVMGWLPSDTLTMNALGWDPIVNASVAEPASLALLSLGLLGMAASRRRKQ